MPKTKDTLIIAAIAIIISLFFFQAGTLTSGYHVTDDHEIIGIIDSLKEKSVLQVSVDVNRSDMAGRFRPLYYTHRVIECAVFGEDYFLWSLYTMGLCILTFSVFYISVRRLGFQPLYALLFLSISFIGTQMAVWWRLGPNETIGSFFLGLSFLFIAPPNRNKYNRSTIWFSVFLVLASWSKESFTVVVPAMSLFKIWWTQKTFHISFKEAVKKNYLLLIPLAVMLFNIYVIVFIIGTNNVSYAGVDISFFTKFNGVLRVLKSLQIYFLILLIFVLSILISKSADELKKSIRALTIPFLIFVLFIAPNIVLHAKSGMYERYYLPATIGVGILSVFLLQEIDSKKRWLMPLIVLLTLFCQRFHYKKTLVYAKEFTAEGFDNQSFFKAVKENYSSNETVLIAADPVESFEATHSISYYVKKADNISLYAYPIKASNEWLNSTKAAEDLTRAWMEWFNGRLFGNMKQQPDMIIVVNDALSSRFFRESGLNPSEYTNKVPNINRYGLYVKKTKLGDAQ